ncbi:MAG: hypothetical protein WBM07_07510 [Chitinivibrionales bacterium]
MNVIASCLLLMAKKRINQGMMRIIILSQAGIIAVIILTAINFNYCYRIVENLLVDKKSTSQGHANVFQEVLYNYLINTVGIGTGLGTSGPELIDNKEDILEGLKKNGYYAFENGFGDYFF